MPKKAKLMEHKKTKYQELIILLIGETGVGKTTLIEAMYEYVRGVSKGMPTSEKELKEFIISYSSPIDKSNENEKAMQSKTMHIRFYEVESNDSKIIFMDVPGSADTKMEKDQEIDIKNIEKMSKTLKEKLDGGAILAAVLVVINGRISRLSSTVKYSLSTTMQIVGKSVKKPSIIPVITNTTSAQDINIEDGSKDLEWLNEKNQICLDNFYGPIEKMKKIGLGQLNQPHVISKFLTNIETTNKAIKQIFSAISIDDNSMGHMIYKNAAAMSDIHNEINRLISLLDEEKNISFAPFIKILDKYDYNDILKILDRERLCMSMLRQGKKEEEKKKYRMKLRNVILRNACIHVLQNQYFISVIQQKSIEGANITNAISTIMEDGNGFLDEHQIRVLHNKGLLD